MASPYPHHLCLLHDEPLPPGDRAFIEELVQGLKERDLQTWCALVDTQPGDDAELAVATALRESAWTLIVRTGAAGPTLRGRLRWATEQQQAEPGVARVIPVRRRGVPERDEALAGLEVIVGIEEREGGVAEVVARIARTAEERGVRTLLRGDVSVVLLADSTELDAEVQAAARFLRGQRGRVRGVEVVAPDAPGAAAQLEAADLVVLLLGASTAGSVGAAVIGGALARREVVAARPRQPDFEVLLARGTDLATLKRLNDQIDQRGGATFTDAPGLVLAIRKPVEQALDRLDPVVDGTAATLTDWERAWLTCCWPGWVRGRHDALQEAAGGSASVLTREQLYVNLHCTDAVIHPTRGLMLRSDRAAHLNPPDQRESPTPAYLDQRLSLPDHRFVAVLGEAGAGKTVLFQHLATVLGEAVLPELRVASPIPSDPDGEAPHHLQLGVLSTLHGAAPLPMLSILHGAAPLPVLFEARLLAPFLERQAPLAALFGLLAQLLDAPEPAAVKNRLFSGRYLLLVDSLDEVPGRARAQVLQALTELARHPENRSRILLSSRPLAHTGLEIPPPFSVTEVAPLSEDRVAVLRARWCRAQGHDLVRAQGLEEALRGLAERFRDSADDGLLPHQNPLLLTCIFLVYDTDKGLPDNRAALYDRMVDILTRTKQGPLPAGDPPPIQSPEHRRQALKRLMLAMQRSGSSALSREAAVSALADYLGAPGRLAVAERALNDVINSTGLLRVDRTDDTVRPWHKSFQEYLAAEALGDEAVEIPAFTRALCGVGPAVGAAPFEVALEPDWQGCLQFLTATIGKGARAEAYVRTLCEVAASPGPGGQPDPKVEAGLLALATAGVAEYRAERFKGSALPDELVTGLARAFAARGERWPWQARLRALDGLGRLGDPRFPDPREVDPRAPGAGWVFVSGRKAQVGEDVREVVVPDLWVRAWPVLVSEFASFVEDGGYHAKDWWTEGRGRDEEEPGGWGEQKRHPNRPVTGVSWFTARAFARWAVQSPRPWRQPVKGHLDLLTIDKWEAVARGPGPLAQTAYPWGPQPPGQGDRARAAHDWEPKGTGPLRAAAPVGAFPLGYKATPGGTFFDLAGNVWAWCATAYDGNRDLDWERYDTPGIAKNSEARAIRVGSWADAPPNLRCAFRVGDRPWNRYEFLGFRLCVSVPPCAD